jgi:carbonic anhydrase
MTNNGVHPIDFSKYLTDLIIDGDPAVGHKADLLLLTCIDFRFFLTISEKMKGIKYDHVILAGAALGAVFENMDHDINHWHRTFFDHLGLAIKLHDVQQVVVLEHRDCGAYGPKGFNLLSEKPDRQKEKDVHMEQVAILKSRLPDGLGFWSCLLEVPPTTQDTLTYERLV